MDVEKKIKQGTSKAATVSSDTVTKQINNFNRICSTVSSTIQTKREEWRNEESEYLSSTCTLTSVFMYILSLSHLKTKLEIPH